ncbi:MAG: hypothetical protein DK304_001177 [Chloroflexi bacterium]|jgi:hypothetical protein|nr:MAG: hypothetical protein DK304_001177 [Chloroflexota bacterium]
MVIGNNKLTAKMEHSTQLLFQGYSQTDAYKLVYHAEARQRLGTLYPNPSLLVANSNVRVRLAHIRAAVVAPALLDAIQRQEFWSDIICDDSKDTRDRRRDSGFLGKA